MLFRSDEAIVSFLRLLLPAGVETTYRSSGNLLFLLLTHPDQLAAVRQDRSLVPQAIEEGLRRETPLTNVARTSYAGQWMSIQEQFVDAPADAVSGAQLLVVAVMTERGYPVEQDDQVLADLSVEHSGTLDRYRAAEEISGKADAGTASTEDLRQAMVHYHALFADLLGEPADSEPADQESRPAVAAGSTSKQFTASDPEEMAK